VATPLSNSAYTRSEHLRALWPWLPLWAAMALLAIFAHGPMPMFSTRTLAVAWEMWSHGHWLVPHINGEPYSEKVPLLFWMIHAGWAVFGVSDIWPRILEVLVGGAQLVLASVLASRLFPSRPWVAKATPWLFMALAYSFLFGLQIMYEVLLGVWVLAALLCLTPTATRASPRWWLFGLMVGAGLLTKGPVMAVHVVFPFLLGPLWNDWARQNKARWYGFGVLGLLIGFAILVAWAIPAGEAGGEAYRQRLFFTQTAGRVVDAHVQDLQNHARPAWYYLVFLPVLLFPLSGWLRGIVAVPTALFRRPWPTGTGASLIVAGVALLLSLVSAAGGGFPGWLDKLLVILVVAPVFVVLMRQPLEPGLRFLVAWLLPTLLTFSLITGKQLYYVMPELAGATMLVAASVADLRERHKGLATHYALGTWPLSIGAFLLAILLFVMPWIVPTRFPDNIWLTGVAPYARFFGVIFVVLGALLLLRGRGEMRRLAFAGLIGTVALNALFTLGLWYRYDLVPASLFLAQADAAGRPIGNLGTSYNGQYHFAGRLMHPIARINVLPGMGAPADDDDDVVRDGDTLNDFAHHHPDGVIVSYAKHPPAEAFRYARLIQPSRTGWLMIWDAATLDALQDGRVPPEPRQPTLLYPQDYWRTRTAAR